MISKFQIEPDNKMVADVRHRLAHTRWTDAVTDDWSQGTQSELLNEIVAYWRDAYDWDVQRAVLNALPQYHVKIDGFGLHFLHARSGRDDAIPLLLMNGWPSSFIEFQRLLPLLVAGDPAFDVVIPTHPGFGFTQKPVRPYEVDPVELYPKLMQQLGYDRFAIAGTDIGAGIATRIALRWPERVMALHLSAVAPRQTGANEPPPSAAEFDHEQRVAQWMRDEGAYQAIQRTKPQTLAFGLADSPVGMASWILEKFHGWTDHDGDLLSAWPIETLIDNLMIYWCSNTIGSSIRYYYEGNRLRAPLAADAFIRVPTGIAVWPADIARPPRELAERLHDVRRFTVMPRGGHFPAWEVPDLYAEELRGLVASVL